MQSDDANKLSTREFWIADRDKRFKFQRHAAGHTYDDLLLKYIPPVEKGSCIEIGSYPGPHLATLGDLGYTLNGLDFNPDNVVGLPSWLKKQGYQIGDFWSEDLFSFQTDNKFDVVCSFGFIEHFVNFNEVIQKHIEMVSYGGFLVITTPNFRGSIQQWLHKTFDKENLSIHNLESMRPDIWEKQLKENGFEILYRGYFGGFWFWKGQPKLSKFKMVTISMLERVINRIRPLLWFESPAFSAHCGIVAKRSVNLNNMK